MEANESKSEEEYPEKNHAILTRSEKAVVPYKFHESIILIIWGWILFLDYFRFYLSRKMVISFDVRNVLEYSSKILVAAGIVYTLYYLNKHRGKLRTDLGKSLAVIWISMFLCMVMVNLIQFNVMHKIVFELQHAIFMAITAFAIVLTGRLIHNKPVFFGGVVFAILAFVSSYLKLEDQLLLEAIGWLIAFIIPGHILYSKQKAKHLLI